MNPFIPPIYVVDAFTDRPFAGNPAGVCPLPGPARADWMQSVAAEMNLAETAFLYPDGDIWRLRWFTPMLEVDLCGHATLASAHVLWESGRVASGVPLTFETRSGALKVAARDAGYEMDFPAVVARPLTPPEGLNDVLGAAPIWTGANGMDLLAELSSEEEVRALRPDFGRLAQYPVRGVIVTARSSDPTLDFVSRFFAPACGILEDPVTGSAHCALGPYWASKLGRDDLVGYQASARGGRVSVGVRGSRVLLGGKAVTMLRGELTMPFVQGDES